MKSNVKNAKYFIQPLGIPRAGDISCLRSTGFLKFDSSIYYSLQN